MDVCFQYWLDMDMTILQTHTPKNLKDSIARIVKDLASQKKKKILQNSIL